MGALRLYCLSSHPNKPCLVLKWPDVTVMLDCGLDMRTSYQFLPLSLLENERLKSLPAHKLPDQQKPSKVLKECFHQVFVDGAVEVCPPDAGLIDFAEIDAILISNHNTMLALPFITERTGFNGAIYATEPTIQYGRLLMEELVEYTERASKPVADPSWKDPDIYKSFASTFLSQDTNPKQWCPLYTLDDVKASVAKIKQVAQSEVLDVCGLLKVTASSSGICIGGCNWIIRTDYEKIVYLASSSALTSHSKMLENEPLKQADVVIVTSLTQAPQKHPDNMLGEFYMAVVNTIRGGGNVLVPSYPMGLIYDLLEYMAPQIDSAGFPHVPIYVVSHVADSALAFANIYAEWLADPKQSKVFLPEEPFLHGQLIKSGRVKPYVSIHGELSTEFKSPCVVFASHPSLRFGDAVHFMELWRNDPKNAVIFVEPDFCAPDVLAPFLPLHMKAMFCPVDTSLNYSHLNNLLSTVRPRMVYAPDKYRKAQVEFAGFPDACIQYEPSPVYFRKHQVLAIPYYKKYLRMTVDPDLASKVDFKQLNGVNVSSLTGLLSYYGNRLVLEPENEASSTEGIVSYPCPYGTLDFSNLVNDLKRNGFSPVEDSSSKGPKCLRLDKEKVRIESTTEANRTHVICFDANENARKRVSDVLLQSLSTF